MVNIREWLDREYPRKGVCYGEFDENNKGKKREEIVELDIKNRSLEGSLNLKEFHNLKKLNCSGNELIGLDISNCINLEELNCSNNNLTNLGLNLPTLKQLEKFYCSNNHLTSLEFSSLNPEKLVALDISNNNFFPCSFDDFGQLVNLKYLWIGNDDESRIQKKVYNKFEGSLKLLKELKHLELLNISNTDIDDGLEYLSSSIKYFYCSCEQRPDSGTKKIVGKLSSYLVDEDEGGYDFQEWVKSERSKRIEDKKIKLKQTKSEDNIKELEEWKKLFGNFGRTSQEAFEEVIKSINEKEITKKLKNFFSEQELPTNWSELLVRKEEFEKFQQQEKTTLQEQLKFLKEEQFVQLQNELREERSKNVSLQEELKKSEKAFLSNKKKTPKEVENELRELRKKEKDLAKELQNHKKEFNKMKKSQEKVRELQSELRENKSVLRRLENDKKSLINKKNKLDNQLRNSQQRIEEIEKKFWQIKESIKEFDDITRSNAINSSLRDKIKKITNRIKRSLNLRNEPIRQDSGFEEGEQEVQIEVPPKQNDL